MARNKTKTLREFNDSDLRGKLEDLKVDLAKLRSEGSKGTLKKKPVLLDGNAEILLEC